jgi:hypothetical protein
LDALTGVKYFSRRMADASYESEPDAGKRGYPGSLNGRQRSS